MTLNEVIAIWGWGKLLFLIPYFGDPQKQLFIFLHYINMAPIPCSNCCHKPNVPDCLDNEITVWSCLGRFYRMGILYGKILPKEKS